MALLQKGLYHIKTQGILKTACLVFDWLRKKLPRLSSRCKEYFFHQRYANQITNHVTGKELYLLTYSFDWNTPLFQRPHQLALALSQQENSHVIFVSDQYCFDNFPGLLSIDSHLDVVSLPFLLRYPNVLSTAKQITVFKSLPLQIKLLDTIPYDTLIYDYIDDLSIIPYRTDEIETLHHKLIANADLTTCTAQALYEDALRFTKKAILVPNACDYALFHQTRTLMPTPDLAQQVSNYECVLGYYGCLEAWRLDYQLILRIAKERPAWCFVLIGQCFDGSDQCLRNSGLSNILLWPAQPHQDLPKFIAAFDIQIIPLVINRIIQATSPIKLFEYMAAGKPILASAMPECMHYKSVTIYHTPSEFIEAVEQLRLIPIDSPYFEVMDREARENTWNSRVQTILEHARGGSQV